MRGTNYLEAALTKTTRQSTLKKHYEEYKANYIEASKILKHIDGFTMPKMLSYKEFIDYYKE